MREIEDKMVAAGGVFTEAVNRSRPRPTGDRILDKGGRQKQINLDFSLVLALQSTLPSATGNRKGGQAGW
jgi:hypothetical protein